LKVVMQVRPGIELASLTDVGCQRENNEDRYSYWEPANDQEFELKGRLAIVADGMGGYEGGQEASRIAVETVEEIYSSSSVRDPRAALMKAFQEAHRRIREHAQKHPTLRNMGTTCTSIVILAGQLYFAHVGDSRLYLIRDGKISRITNDHSYVGKLVEHGVIRAEDAETHPQRHILTSALGSGPEIFPDVPESPRALQSGDVLVLCSDGLWGVVGDQAVESAVAATKVSDAAATLVEKAKALGGPDNITLQILRVN
jgi:serine/threonine protein phosphatase PrpC